MEKEKATDSSILAWKIPWTEEPCRLQSMGCKESDKTEEILHTGTASMRDLLDGSVVKILQCKSCRRCRFNPWVGKIQRRRKQQSTPVFLPGEPHEQWSLVDHNPSGHTEWDTVK